MKSMNNPRYMAINEAIEYARNRYQKEHGKLPIEELTLEELQVVRTGFGHVVKQTRKTSQIDTKKIAGVNV